MSRSVLFLAWESPWPAISGASLRSLGLLEQLARRYPVDLVLLTRSPLTTTQESELRKLARSIRRVPLLDRDSWARRRIIWTMLRRGLPYHPAALKVSLEGEAEARAFIDDYPGTVFTSLGHWGSLVADRPSPSPHWILNQCDADVQFWSGYARYASHPLVKVAAVANEPLARRLFPTIYAKVGRVISVCEEDRRLTEELAPTARVEVVENGVDCRYFSPSPDSRSPTRRVLFTGTSAPRNLAALSYFVTAIWPNVLLRVPDARLCVAGNFDAKSRGRFQGVEAIDFTGFVEDIRPHYWSSRVFVAPFVDGHGSKLKVAQAMAMGLPVVATPAGIRGFDIVDGESALVGKTDAEFAERVSAMLLDPNRAARVGAAAREFAIRRLDWKILGERLANIVDETARS